MSVVKYGASDTTTDTTDTTETPTVPQSPVIDVESIADKLNETTTYTPISYPKVITATYDAQSNITSGTIQTLTVSYTVGTETINQVVDVDTDKFSKSTSTGGGGEIISTITPDFGNNPTTKIQEVTLTQNTDGTSTSDLILKNASDENKTISINFTPTLVNQEFKDDGSIEINITPDTAGAKKSKIVVTSDGNITNYILDDNNATIVSSTTQIQDANLSISADGNITIEAIIPTTFTLTDGTTINTINTNAIVSTTSSSSKVQSTTKIGTIELKSSADVATGTTVSQNITSGGDVEIIATASGRSKKIKTTAQATTIHTVTNDDVNTTAIFDIAGFNITSNIGDENITTIVDTNETYPSTISALVGDELFEGVVITNDDGTTQTKFRITNTVTGAQRYVDSTVDTTTSLPQGTNSTIKLVDGKLVIENKQTTTSKTTLKIGVANDNN